MQVGDRYRIGRRSLIEKMERDQDEITAEIRELRSRGSNQETRAEIEAKWREYDHVNARAKVALRNLEAQRDEELEKRRAKNPWSF